MCCVASSGNTWVPPLRHFCEPDIFENIGGVVAYEMSIHTAVAEFRIVFSLNIFSSKGSQLQSLVYECAPKLILKSNPHI